MDAKIHKLDVELVGFKKKIATTKSAAAKQNLKRRAMQILQQKKVYEKQRDQIYGQQFNVDQTKFAAQSAQDTVHIVSAMKSANKDLKKQFKQIDIDEIDDLRDDMADLMEMSEEVNDMLGQSYAVPDDLDETDLLDELEALDDDLEFNIEEETPSCKFVKHILIVDLVSAQSAANKESLPEAPSHAALADAEEEKLKLEA